MSLPVPRRVQVALDCECGTSLEGCDDEELFDELVEHIAAGTRTACSGIPAPC